MVVFLRLAFRFTPYIYVLPVLLVVLAPVRVHQTQPSLPSSVLRPAETRVTLQGIVVHGDLQRRQMTFRTRIKTGIEHVQGEGGQVVEGEEETLDVGQVGEGTRRKNLDPVLAQPETCESLVLATCIHGYQPNDWFPD